METNKKLKFEKSFCFNVVVKSDLYNYGYYLNNALHFYGNGTEHNFDSYTFVTNIINELYGEMLKNNFVCYGQDVFGNQFVKCEEKYYFLNIETAELEFLSNNLNEMFEAIEFDSDYYSGYALTKNLFEEEIIQLSNGFRLCPKKPFVIGGEFNTENLYLLDLNSCLQYNFDIAAQIYNLQDGTEVNIIFDSKKNI